MVGVGFNPGLSPLQSIQATVVVCRVPAESVDHGLTELSGSSPDFLRNWMLLLSNPENDEDHQQDDEYQQQDAWVVGGNKIFDLAI